MKYSALKIIIFTALMLFPIAAFAHDEAEINLYIQAHMESDETITLELYLDGTVPTVGGDVFIGFPAQYLDFLSFTPGDGLINTIHEAGLSDSGDLILIFASPYAIQTGHLGSFSFEFVSADEKPSLLEFTLEAGTFVGDNTIDVLSTNTQGTTLEYGNASIPSPEAPTMPSGDINRDMRTDSGDAAILLRYEAGYITLTDEQQAAVTSESITYDAETILRITLKL